MNKYMAECIFYDEFDRGMYDDSAELIIVAAGYYLEEDVSYVSQRQVERMQGRYDYHFCYVKDGALELTVGDNNYHISKACFIIPPNTPYRYHNAYDEGAYELYWVHFTGNKAEEYLQGLFLTERFYHLGDLDEVRNLIETLVRELTFKINHYTTITQSLLLYALALVSRRVLALKSGSAEPMIDLRMQRTLEYIYLYYATDISIHEMADLCQLSDSRFSSLFKKTFGLYPLQYIINYRIKRAGSLLCSTSYSVAQIGEMCGFDDSMYFSRIFKKKTGLTPTTYRNKMNPAVYGSNLNVFDN